MIQVSLLRQHRDDYRARLQKRGWTDEQLALLDDAIRHDDTRKAKQTALDAALAEQKQLSGQIGRLMKVGKREEANAVKAQVAEGKAQSQQLKADWQTAGEELERVLLQIPNVPHESVPAGTSEADNEVYQDWPAPLPELPGEAHPHWELAKAYNLFDLELGVKITGSGFPVYRGQGARLERALINFFLDAATAAGYEEVMPPLLVNADSARATGQLPDKEGQMYHAAEDDFYLIPTAEVPLTNIYRDEIVEVDRLPLKLTGHTPCFRREAGSYGKDVRGLNRVHQFNKVEIVQIAHPDESYAVLDEMLDHVKGLLDQLELPYRILRLCGGDLGFTSALTYDFEVYSAAQRRWLEVSSVSNFETYQTNRLKLRYRDGKSKALAHSLNGSALALARIVAALLENNQTPDGIRLPACLHRYTGFQTITR